MMLYTPFLISRLSDYNFNSKKSDKMIHDQATLHYANEFLSSMLTSADWMLKTAKSSNMYIKVKKVNFII